MMVGLGETSPRLEARVAGGLYLLIIVGGLFSEIFVRGRLVVAGNAAATAANVLAHETLYRAGGVAMLVATCCDVAVSLVLYALLKPVSRRLSVLAASFRFMTIAIVAVNLFNHFAPLVLVKGVPFSTTFTGEQLRELALASLELYPYGFSIAMVFFGFSCLLIGYLTFQSTFLPRVLGVLMALAGLSYLIHSFAVLLAPGLGSRLFPSIMLPPLVGELSLALWLLVKGVDAARWQEQARTAGDRRTRAPSPLGSVAR